MKTERIQKRRVFIALLLVTVLCAACTIKQEAKNTEPLYANYDDSEEAMPETEPPVRVEMPDYELTYSGELKDVIVVNEVEGENALEFKVKLSKGEAHIFTLRYNTEAGEFVTIKEDVQGNRVPVAFEMAPIPENLSEEDRNVFFEAQDAVNEIVESLVLK